MTKIAFILADGYEDSEFRQPYDALKKAGHDITIIGLEAGQQVKGKRGEDSAEVAKTARDVEPGDFDALVIPGGKSPDKLRKDKDLVAFTRSIVDSGKPTAAICHGAQVLVEADAVRNKVVTSWPGVKEEVEEAGGDWVDLEVCVTDNLITSRKPEDIPAFIRAIEEQIATHSS